MPKDNHINEASRMVAERLALPTGGYPNVWAMSQDEYDEYYSKWLLICTDSQCDEDEIDGYLDPDQIRFHSALEARFNKETEDEDREYDKSYSALVDEGLSPEKARKIASEMNREYLEKLHVKRTKGDAAWDADYKRMVALFFPVALVLNLFKPGILRDFYPRLYSAWHGVGNWLMMAVLPLLFLLPVCTIAYPFGLKQIFLVAMVLLLFFWSMYAPWYTILTLVPFLFLYAATSAVIYGNRHTPVSWTAFCFCVWTLYPFVRGMGHFLGWEKERKAGLPNHRVSKHPWLLFGTSLLMTTGIHYMGKSSKSS
jgi:hypothetical protein